MAAWQNSTRRQQLPKNWQHLRSQTMRRAGGRCQATLQNGTRCPAQGTDCDHIQRGNNHSPSNLQWLCPWHHKRKTHDEATQALAAKRQENQPAKRLHPGLVVPPQNASH